jgi:dihydromethanopterin reductase
VNPLGHRRVQCHRGANERLQRIFINLVTLMEINGTHGVAFRAGVEKALTTFSCVSGVRIIPARDHTGSEEVGYICCKPMEMRMIEVRAMCAIGLRGQLGLRGRLPWEGRQDPEFPEDVRRFWAATLGHVLLAGPRTTQSIPTEAYASRTIMEIRSSMVADEVLAQFEGRVVFIGGGPAVWTAFAPLIQHWDITRLPYDGEADRWFDPAWLCGKSP